MEMLEQFMRRNNLRDEEDIDSLLEVADLTRELIGGNRYEEICRLINYTVENSFYEAFSWIMEILQEEFDKQDSCALDDFVCRLGKSIPDYDAFAERLQVDFRALKNDIETMLDENIFSCLRRWVTRFSRYPSRTVSAQTARYAVCKHVAEALLCLCVYSIPPHCEDYMIESKSFSGS